MSAAMKWEKIDDSMYRTRTPTGWLVRECQDVAHIGPELNEYVTTGYDWRVAMTFVPDPDGVWLADKTGGGGVMTAIYVCPERDIECGRNIASWCETCPQRKKAIYMTTENNVAAQAGDEPMPCPFCGFDESSFEAYSVQPDNFHSAYVQCDQCDARGPNALTVDGWLPNKEEAIAEAIKAWNSQVSPRATADVERESKRLDVLIAMAPNSFELIDQKWYLLDPRGRIAGKGETKRDAIDAAIATTKPGA